MEILDHLSQMFLSKYFLFDSICGIFLTEKERHKVFFEMTKIFCLPENKKIKELFQETEKEHFRTITDFASYERFCRLLEFAEKTYQQVVLSPSEKKILAQKRAALNARQDLFGTELALTEEDIYSTLLSTAMNGNTDAMTTLAFMEIHGICIFKDKENAIKRIRLCAEWNNIFGLLMGIMYDENNKQDYYNRLYTILHNENRKQIFGYICKAKHFEGPFTKDDEAKILERAFELETADRKIYNSNFATVAFSEIISVEDKKKLLLGGVKRSIDSLSDIPFSSAEKGIFTIDETKTENLPLIRDSETRKIIQNLKLAQRGPAEICSPLLIIAPDKFISDMYRDMITDILKDTPIAEIDAGTLDTYDLAPTRENVILRSLGETKTVRTVFIIKNCEELDRVVLDDLHNLLDYNYRKKFPLNNPAVAIDLSEAVFILFSHERDGEINQLIADCDTVYAEKISTEEKKTVIRTLFTNSKLKFGIPNAELSEECINYLLVFDTEKLQRIIDGTLKKLLFSSKNGISEQDIKTVCKEQNITSSKTGFGYVGGNIYA